MADVRMCGFERRTSVADALARLRSRCEALEAESVSVEVAAGRIAAEDVVATIAVPHFARSMMDGYALVAASTFGATPTAPRWLDVVGEVRAGVVPMPTIAAGQALRITTGAPIPDGADAVLMAELAEIDGERVAALGSVSPGKHIGSVGEDIALGATIIRRGRLLRPADAGIAASVGVASLSVVRRPRVRVVVTGNELCAPGTRPTAAHIADSNSVVLRALAERDGAEVEVLRLRDERDAIGEAMTSGDADLVLLSGGSSVGPEDHAPLLLAELGELCVHGVAMRPSSPAGFGFIGARHVMLLPGNPVSALCAYEFFAGPAIRALGGRAWEWPHRRTRARVANKLVSVLGRTDFMRVTLDDDGVHPLMTSGASILSSITRADGVVIIADEHEGHAEGDEVEVLLF